MNQLEIADILLGFVSERAEHLAAYLRAVEGPDGELYGLAFEASARYVELRMKLDRRLGRNRAGTL